MIFLCVPLALNYLTNSPIVNGGISQGETKCQIFTHSYLPSICALLADEVPFRLQVFVNKDRYLRNEQAKRPVCVCVHMSVNNLLKK